MTRTAQVTANTTLAPTPANDRAARPAARRDTAEDRLGAQAAYDQQGTEHDPWIDLARLLITIMQRGPATPDPTATDNITEEEPDLVSEPTPATTKQDGQPAQATGDEAPTDTLAALPATQEYRILQGAVPPPEPGAVETPELPQTPLEELPQAEVAALPGAPPPAVSGPGGPAPAPPAGGGGSARGVVRRWQAGVRGAGGGVTQARVVVNPQNAAATRTASGAARRRNQAAREGMTEEAVENVPEMLEVEDAPPPPPSNPVPTHTTKILRLSNKTLPDQEVPELQRSDEHTFIDSGTTEITVGGNLPRLNDRPVPSDTFNIITSPDATALAERLVSGTDAEGNPNPEAARMADAIAHFEPSPEAAAQEQEAPGEQVITPDNGPEPVPALPEDLRAPVGQVVARMLAQTDRTTETVLDRLRETAFRNGVLKENFPDIGAGLSEGLRTAISTELHDIAEMASVSSEELEGMIAEQQAELSTSATEATAEAAQITEETTAEVTDEGQKTMDSIEGAAQTAEEETVRRQEEAGGAADPTVINARRDLTVNWIRNHVTTQITDYQNAGDRRARELIAAQTTQRNAYDALVQREQYEVLTPRDPRPPRDTSDQARERRLADATTSIRQWGDTARRDYGEDFRLKIKAASDTTKSNRDKIQKAGSEGIEAARQWAEDKIHENDSWWDRMMRRFQRWFTEAQDVNENWRVRRTRESRDAIATDMQLVNAAQEMLASGLTQEQIQQNTNLTSAQRAVIAEYFAQPAGAHPLDFAVKRLSNSIAAGHLEHARTVFENEVAATSVGEGDFTTAGKIIAVARAQGGNFNPEQIVTSVHAAVDQWGTDEQQIFTGLRGLTRLKGIAVRKLYYARFGRDLDAVLRDEMSGDELNQAQAQLDGHAARAEAIALHDAIAGLGTDEAAIMRTLRNKTPTEIEAIRAEYLSRYGETLDAALEDDLGEGNEIDQANALMAGDNELADAIAMDEAMRGGFLGMGTDEGEIENVQSRVRAEVLQRAQAENWTSEQMEAEVRRRLGRIEENFEERYANVEQYNAPGLEGDTVLSRAFSSELSGPERDLSQALQDNDLIAADAARIEIERLGFYASDTALNGVLRSQYERALQARRLDEGPARNAAVRQAVDQARRDGLSEEEISRIRMRLERQMENELQDGAQEDSRMSMQQLEQTYQDNYTWPLDFVLDWNMSGDERNKARNMLEQGGRLDPLQEIEYATRGAGTDEDTLRRVISTMTSAEIETVRREWERRHPGRSFDGMLRGELSGRDESDIMDMVEHGAPESAIEQIEQEGRRVRRERDDLTGILGRSISSGEEAWMEHQLSELEDLRGPLERTDWPDTPEARREREQLQREVSYRVATVQDAVTDHRRRLDSFTDAATQAVGLVVGITVAVVLGAVSGGTLGAATIALMASIAATASTMATKALVLGGAYGEEAIATDLAVGAVDALASVATAGLGKSLLGPLEALVARVPVGRVVGFLGRTGIARQAARLPGAGAVGQLARGALPTAARTKTAVAGFIGDSIEDAAGALPSAFVQTALTDGTWEGDPLMTFLNGGGMTILQSIAMGRTMAGGINLGGRVFRAGRGRLRMGSDVGRLLEANRLIQEGHARFARDNPGACLAEFLAHPDGRQLRQRINDRGLMPDIEAANRALEAEKSAPTGRRGADADTDPQTRQLDAEVRAEALTEALPPGLREGTFVTPDPDLPGRTVRVEPLRIGNKIVGVEIRVGPDATPMDIAMHGATVHAMQRYRGVLGDVRRVLEDLAAVVTRSGLTVGSRGWEARLEIGKLNAIVAARLDELGGRPLTPEMEARVLADVAHLEQQLRLNQHIMTDPDLRGAPGRGHVAADDVDLAMGGRLAEAEWDIDLIDPNTGDITDAGRFDLEAKVNFLRQRLRALHDAPDAAAASRELDALIDTVADTYGIRPDDLRQHLTETGDAGRIDALLDRTGRLRPEHSMTPETDPITGRLPSETGEQFMQRQVDAHRDSLDGPSRAQPNDIVARIAAGDPTAQAELNAISQAPPEYELVEYNTARLEAELSTLDNGPGAAFYTGLIRIGDGTVQITRNQLPPGVTVDANGFQINPDGTPRTTANGEPMPEPPILFHDEFPPWDQVGNRVLQLEDGRLRVWREPPTPENPEGRLRQESIVGPRQRRRGYEKVGETYSQAGLRGPPTELGHVHGAGRGVESPFGIMHVPREVNQTLQKDGIEALLSRLQRDAPNNVQFHYATAVTHQGGGVRAASVEYIITATINGVNVPFADFTIHIAPLPDNIPPDMVRARDIVTIDPIRFHTNADPNLQSFFSGMRETVDVPRVLTDGLPQDPRIGQVIDNLLATDVGDLDAALSTRPHYRGHRPEPAASFQITTWEARLHELLAARSPRARLIVIDVREVDLTPDQLQQIADAITRLPAEDYERVLPIATL